MLKLIPLIPLLALSLICFNAKSQCDIYHTRDTTVCEGSPVTLYASGAYSYTWTTSSNTVVENSENSTFVFPFDFTSWVRLYSRTERGVSSHFIVVSFAVCTGIIENEPNSQVQPVYYDLTGNKAEPIQGQLLIEKRGLCRRKVLIQ